MKKSCEICGGSGQIGHFQGVSRFVITWDECPDCNGTGLASENETDAEKVSPSDSAGKNQLTEQQQNTLPPQTDK